MKQNVTTIAAITFLYSLLLLISIALILPPSIMECRNWIVAREMVSEGNWILTTMNGVARYEKPPLPTWLSAFSGYLFGFDSSHVMRLPGILCGAALSVLIQRFSVALGLAKNQYFITGGIAASSLYCILIIFEAPWDIFAHTNMLLAIYLGYSGLQKEGGIRAFYRVGVILASSFSFLSKGPIGLFALFLPFVLSALYFKPIARKKIILLFVLVLLGSVLGSWWFIYIRWADPETFLQVAKTESTRWTNYNVRPFYYYWSFFIQIGVWALLALAALFFGFYTSKRPTESKEQRKKILLVVFWTFLAVVLLSCIPEKKSRYLMPVLIPLAIVTAFFVERVVNHIQTLKPIVFSITFKAHFWIMGAISIVFPFAVIYVYLSKMNISLFMVFASFLIWVLLWIGIRFYRRGNWLKLIHINFGFILFVVNYGAVVYADLAHLTKKDDSIKEVIALARKKGMEIYSLEHPGPELVWALESITPVIELKDWPANKNQRMILLINNELEVPKNIQGEIEERATDSFDVGIQYNLFDADVIHPRKSAQIYMLDSAKR